MEEALEKIRQLKKNIADIGIIASRNENSTTSWRRLIELGNMLKTAEVICFPPSNAKKAVEHTTVLIFLKETTMLG